MIYMTNCKVILTVLEYFLVELVVYKLITESLQSGDMPSRHEVIKKRCYQVSSWKMWDPEFLEFDLY